MARYELWHRDIPQRVGFLTGTEASYRTHDEAEARRQRMLLPDRVVVRPVGLVALIARRILRHKEAADGR